MSYTEPELRCGWMDPPPSLFFPSPSSGRRAGPPPAAAARPARPATSRRGSRSRAGLPHSRRSRLFWGVSGSWQRARRTLKSVSKSSCAAGDGRAPSLSAPLSSVRGRGSIRRGRSLHLKRTPLSVTRSVSGRSASHGLGSLMKRRGTCKLRRAGWMRATRSFSCGGGGSRRVLV